MPFGILFPDGFSALTKPATSLFTLYVSLNAFSGDHCDVRRAFLFRKSFLFFFRTDSTDSPDCLPILLSISVIYRVGQKNRTVFRLDNFVTVSPRKVCSMSKFLTFYPEKGIKLAFQ